MTCARCRRRRWLGLSGFLGWLAFTGCAVIATAEWCRFHQPKPTGIRREVAPPVFIYTDRDRAVEVEPNHQGTP